MRVRPSAVTLTRMNGPRTRCPARLGGCEAAFEEDAFGMNCAGVVLPKCGVQRIEEVFRYLLRRSRFG